ncbi:MAG: tetratricopeptide repeat protein, partial [Clostridia bacterium]|nr:tetratricopeptide repeat protein [Clostridia bacterium]
RLWYLNGMIYFDSKNYEKARDAYIQADKLIPNDPSTMFALANTYDALKEYQKAYDLCKQIQSLYPNGTEHLVDLYGVSGHVGGLMNSLRGYVKED